jgi:hypothetical protein
MRKLFALLLVIAPTEALAADECSLVVKGPTASRQICGEVDGTWYQSFPRAAGRMPGVFGRAGRATVVSDSTSETSLYSTTVDAGVMSTDGIVHLMITGAYTNSTGANQTLRVRVKFGGVELWNDVTGNATTNANEHGVRIDLFLANDGAANSQTLTGDIDIGGVGGATTGSGDLGNDEIQSTAIITTPSASTVDTTSAQTLEVTVQLSTATAGGSVRRDMAFAELK